MRLLMLALFSFFFQSTLLASDKEKICLDRDFYQEIIKTLEDNSKTIQVCTKELSEKNKAIDSSSIKIDPITIIQDKDGRVYVKDKTKGVLTIGSKKYDLDLNLKTTIVRSQDQDFFSPKLKAYALATREKQGLGLGVDFLRYKMINLNAIVATNVVGLGLGVDVTKHSDIVLGFGTDYNLEKQVFIGIGFDL